jgi:hypothetical protein
MPYCVSEDGEELSCGLVSLYAKRKYGTGEPVLPSAGQIVREAGSGLASENWADPQTLRLAHTMADPANMRELARICEGHRVPGEFQEEGPWDVIARSFNDLDNLDDDDEPRFSHIDPYNGEISHLAIGGPPLNPVTGPALKLKWSHLKSLCAVPRSRFDVSGNMSQTFICFLENNPHKAILLYFHLLLDGNAGVAAAAKRDLPIGLGVEVGVGSNGANDRVVAPVGGRRQSTMPNAAIAALASISSTMSTLAPSTPPLEQQAAEARRLDAESRRADAETMAHRTAALQNLSQAIKYDDITPKKKQKYNDKYEDLLDKV